MISGCTAEEIWVQSTSRGKAQGIAASLRSIPVRVNGTDVTFGHASFGDMVASSELGLELTTTYGQRPAPGGGVANGACPLNSVAYTRLTTTVVIRL